MMFCRPSASARSLALSLSRAQEFEFTTPTVSLRRMRTCVFSCKACWANTDFSLLLDRLAEHNLICSVNVYFKFNLRPSAKMTTMHFLFGENYRDLGSNLLSQYLFVSSHNFSKCTFFYSVVL